VTARPQLPAERHPVSFKQVRAQRKPFLRRRTANHTITFAKVSSLGWLNAAGTGGLSGMPLFSNVGANSFIVSATDPGGLSGSATLNITVMPAPPILVAVSLQDTNLLLNWNGGIAPYQVQMTTTLVGPAWQPVGAPTNGASLLLPASNAAAFYRIRGQ
jgi:hypothetical protein